MGTRCLIWNYCMNTEMGKRFFEFRSKILEIVATSIFEWVILVLIFASSITLCFEDIYLDSNKPLKRILYWTNFIFCAIFILEMLMKWIALGFYKYFTDFWSILDFWIVFVSFFFVEFLMEMWTLKAVLQTADTVNISSNLCNMPIFL